MKNPASLRSDSWTLSSGSGGHLQPDRLGNFTGLRTRQKKKELKEKYRTQKQETKERKLQEKLKRGPVHRRIGRELKREGKLIYTNLVKKGLEELKEWELLCVCPKCKRSYIVSNSFSDRQAICSNCTTLFDIKDYRSSLVK